MSRDHRGHGPTASDAYSAKWSSHVESPTRARLRREVYGEAKGNLGLTDGTDYLAHSRRIFVVARKRTS
jgi:hypothetical protein